MLKAVIFDFDGLIVDSERVIFEAEKELLDEFGAKFTWKYYSQHLGLPMIKGLKCVYDDFMIPVDFEEFVRRRNEVVGEYMEKNLRLMPNLVDVLNFLRDRDIDMYVASSGRRLYVEGGLKRFDILKYFVDVVTVEDVKNGKPAPDLFEEALRRSGVKSEEALVLEDSINGIKSARDANLFCIAVPAAGVDLNGYSEASVVCQDLRGVLDLFELMM